MKRLLATLAIAFALAGCGLKTATIQHPGAVNVVDDRIYSALLNAKVIPPFNALESAYKTYHTALAAGQAADAAPLQAQLDAITAALADALRTVGAKPPPPPTGSLKIRKPVAIALSFGRET